MSLKASLNSILEKLGRDGPTAPRPSQDNVDAAAHEYNVAAFISSYGDKRKDLAKKALVSALGPATAQKLVDEQESVANNEISNTIELAVAAHHSVSAQVKIGATYLDTQSLKVELMKKMKAVEVDALFERHTKRRTPSVTYVVSESDGG